MTHYKQNSNNFIKLVKQGLLKFASIDVKITMQLGPKSCYGMLLPEPTL